MSEVDNTIDIKYDSITNEVLAFLQYKSILGIGHRILYAFNTKDVPNSEFEYFLSLIRTISEIGNEPVEIAIDCNWLKRWRWSRKFKMKFRYNKDIGFDFKKVYDMWLITSRDYLGNPNFVFGDITEYWKGIKND